MNARAPAFMDRSLRRNHGFKINVGATAHELDNRHEAKGVRNYTKFETFDIGLIELNEPLIFSDTIQSIPLQPLVRNPYCASIFFLQISFL